MITIMIIMVMIINDDSMIFLWGPLARLAAKLGCGAMSNMCVFLQYGFDFLNTDFLNTQKCHDHQSINVDQCRSIDRSNY